LGMMTPETLVASAVLKIEPRLCGSVKPSRISSSGFVAGSSPPLGRRRVGKRGGHVSCSNEAEYIRLNPIIKLLISDKSLKYREKVDKDGRTHIYFITKRPSHD